MEAWKASEHIDFDFFDAHDLFISRDTSKPETIKRNLRERLKNAKQVVLLGSKDGKRKGSDGISFLAHEIEVIIEFNLQVVVANLDGDRLVDKNYIPNPLLNADYYTVSVSYQPKIVMYALYNYADTFAASTTFNCSIIVDILRASCSMATSALLKPESVDERVCSK